MTRHRPQRLAAICLSMFLATLAGCDLWETPSGPDATQDKQWQAYLSTHTSGLISKKSHIRVRFVNAVVNKDMIGQDAASVFKIEPAVDGSVTFASTREIVLVPSQDLKSGGSYRVTLKAKGLSNIQERLKDYRFTFNVIKQEFEVNVSGLTTDPADEARMVLKGSLVTADAEDAERVEKILSATFLDKPLAIDWQHSVDGRRHDFAIGGIVRQAAREPLHLKWDGAAIDDESKGERVTEVPAKGEFKVTQIQAIQDERQYVIVYFSDNIDTRQNLRGLIGLSKGSYTTRIEGNTIRLYPEKPLRGSVVVTVEPGIRNTKGGRVVERLEQSATFISQKPQVRFAGKGVILPDNKVLSIPFEAVNVRAVRVTAFRIYENNVGQFLQTNKLDGDKELGRVGRYLWRRTIPLTAPEPNKWNRYSLDATELLRENPGGLFRLTLSITRADSNYGCPGEAAVPDAPQPLVNDEDLKVEETSSWGYYEDYYGESPDSGWRNRENPCTDAYYQYAEGVKDSRNFLGSNIGLLAKRDQRGKVFVVATDLRTSAPMNGVKVSILNFQDQVIGTLSTNAKGIGEIELPATPFYLLAEKGGQRGYLKLSKGAALPISHFDVGGQQVSGGLKGQIYGERGVWRPGDDIYLTFVLQDKDQVIPDNHPVTMELYNPKGQRMQSVTNTMPVDGFYAFTLRTADDAPTGNWTAKAILGGTTFSKTLKIETVMPNRLKVELDFDKTVLRQSEMPLKGSLFGQWLNGATAADLKADVKVRLRSVPTRFERFDDFVFDDPAREFSSEPQVLFEGKLDGNGRASFRKSLEVGEAAPGMLAAGFASRVFERGGAFSTSRKTLPFSPYDNYVGIKLPKGDKTRGMLLTDTVHSVQLGSLSADGTPVSLKNIQVTLYKIDWKWWWDKSGESLARYASASHSSVVMQGNSATVDGRGTWEFEIKYPSWGRYLVRACDLQGAHCTGKVFYIDWPGWAGRAQEEGGAGASVLSFFADKPEYQVGEVAKIKLPEATQGRALVTIESGTRIVEQRWIEFKKANTRFEVPITAAMSPNVFVSVTLIQPHAGKKNDRPIRLYGVIPIKVSDPKTRLEPVLKAAEEWEPESTVSIDVSEAGGRAMTYTVAVVDEGLLGLTGFKTPDLHGHFYKKEALGVTTWDLFDLVAGAYGGELERLLALGGSDDGEEPEDVSQDKKRFPPVVRFLGPFKLKAKGGNTHEVELPPYIGAVRVMVVAGRDGAYGSTDKSVFVREALTMLPTLPRVAGPGEDLTVPVSLFVMEPGIKEVTLKIETDEHFQVIGEESVKVGFARPEERLGLLRLKVGEALGKGRVRFVATAGEHSAEAEVFIDVRSPNPATVQYLRKTLKPGKHWKETVVPHGLPGTNTVALELSAVPPLNLERRLDYLIRYPHGCVEQVTSSVFPQLYLPALVKLEDTRKQEIERNVQAGVERLRGFQVPSGAFTYWPGGFLFGGGFDARNAWSTNYVGHFLIEAEKLGYHVPADMKSSWLNYQRSAAQSWPAGGDTSELDQAYRLYTLAAANQPEIGAMNRLRESSTLSTVARWQLAAAYRLAGLTDAADELVGRGRIKIKDYDHPDFTFGSRLRDTAIVLNSALLLKREDEAKDLAEEVSDELASDDWLSTQSVAHALLAMARYAGGADAAGFAFTRQIGGAKAETVTAKAPIHAATLAGFPLEGAPVEVRNTSERVLYASIVVKGMPRAGEERASASGLELEVSYNDAKGGKVDIERLRQGADFVAELSVSNRTDLTLDNLALTQVVPSGWEIHNARLDGEEGGTELDYLDIRDDRVYRYFGLKPGETKRFKTVLNAAYIGRYYLPSVAVEAMYDATKQARTKGRWVEVAGSGR